MDNRSWPAFILHSRAFKEQQLLVQLLLPELGRVSAVIRKSNSKKQQRLSLQPFQLLQLELVGRSDLKTVSKAEETGPAFLLQGEKLFGAMYLNELICRLWPENVGSDALFDLYQQSLQQLLTAELEPCLRQFEFSLLTELGQPVDWGYDSEGESLQDGALYQWWPEQGWQIAGKGWKGAVLKAIGQQQWQQQDVLKAAKQLSRLWLAPLLGSKPLTSRALFQSIRN
ncbi:DNA repair protein RecO [Rheinheimera sp.]|uniref:DNA repair protein RecO n=1 Tax=Rheinheimera sp. TaxID=1869214 RepID=UPI00262FF6C7|nr:DNA repair protein RecO [Rheinheimera sp.]MCA1931249.1 DNA repair protein RecO [Rheinheimera sp.]